MARNTAPMIAARAAIAQEKEEYVLATIRTMVDAGESVNFYSVQKVTGCAKSFLHNNQTIAKAVRHAGKETSKLPNETSAAVLLKAAQAKIKALEKELNGYRAENTGTYKAMYEKALKENRELKKQLECAYKYE